jgi:hypothetical protein
MKYLIAFLFSLALALGSFAQAPAMAPQHFVMSGSAASYGGNGAAAIASSGIQLTTNVSAVYEFISNPQDSSKPRVGSGVVNYTRSAASFVPASLKSKLLIDLTNYNVTFQAGAGRESLASAVVGASRTTHVVGNFGVFGGYPLPGGHTQIGMGYKFIVGPAGANVIKVPTGNLVFTF